ncbi:MAG TPA: prepilin-type N-terminal cleavage/methylation domain-containing protein [Chthoniobacterales bacterium]|nr:prepilin-type N-terminal cleavage/methylation domain-containing protein [Chthoniobacterales bacterium]
MNTKMRNKQKGFSLIELLIVVAIILIIAAIAIPNLIRSKMAANEASAVATLRTINTSEVVYSSTYNTAAVFGTLPQLGSAGSAGASCTPTALQATPPTSDNSCLIDNALEVANVTAKSGYLVKVVVAKSAYTGNNDPSAPGSSGTRHFFTDQSLVIRQNAAAAAGPGDPPI